MKVKQISVFLENRKGRLAEVLDLLAAEEINIRALSLADTSDFGILRLIVPDPEHAKRVLRQARFAVSETPVLAVAVADRPGGLAGVLKAMSTAGINVEYLYAFVEKHAREAVVILRVEDTGRAEQVLTEGGVRTIDPGQLAAL